MNLDKKIDYFLEKASKTQIPSDGLWVFDDKKFKEKVEALKLDIYEEKFGDLQMILRDKNKMFRGFMTKKDESFYGFISPEPFNDLVSLYIFSKAGEKHGIKITLEDSI